MLLRNYVIAKYGKNVRFFIDDNSFFGVIIFSSDDQMAINFKDVIQDSDVGRLVVNAYYGYDFNEESFCKLQQAYFDSNWELEDLMLELHFKGEIKL